MWSLALDGRLWIASLDVPFSEIEGWFNFRSSSASIDGGDDAVALKSRKRSGVSAFVSAKFGSVWSRSAWIQTFAGRGGLVRPRINWAGIKNATFGLGLGHLHRSEQRVTSGRYNDRDRAYCEVSTCSSGSVGSRHAFCCH
ncbi:MAG: hypothetical protein IPN24_16130 [Betaproteobacteria bacterium]|nr:hypothetical protein [Betaproteobacteria bacterium]